jgi:Alginate lyase
MQVTSVQVTSVASHAGRNSTVHAHLVTESPSAAASTANLTARRDTATSPRWLCRDADAAAYAQAAVKRRLRAQIAGALMPAELVRPKSYAYHSFTLEIYARLALHAGKLGVDLWRFNAEEGNSILVRSARHECVPAIEGLSFVRASEAITRE